MKLLPFPLNVTTKKAYLMAVDLFDELGFQIVVTKTNEKVTNGIWQVETKIKQHFSGTEQSRKLFTQEYARKRCDSNETNDASYAFVFTKRSI